MSEKENKNKEIQESVTAVPEANNEIKETTGADMEVYAFRQHCFRKVPQLSAQKPW